MGSFNKTKVFSLIVFIIHTCICTSQNKIDYTNSYSIDDSVFGTKTKVTIEDKNRVIETNGLPNHKTGDFPNPGNPNRISAQELKYTFPLNPVYTGNPKKVREPGVAINGVKFEPETAERFECETGEVYRIEAFQNLVNLGLDNNNAHVQPTGAYHYHGIPVALLSQLESQDDLMLIGFARDGYPIYYSQSNTYRPSYKLSKNTRTGDVCSYSTPRKTINKDLKNTDPDGTFVSDWEFVKDSGQLDECNGTFIDGKYAYFVTLSYPYIGRCLMGEFTEPRPKGPPPGFRPNGNVSQRPPRPSNDFSNPN